MKKIIETKSTKNKSNLDSHNFIDTYFMEVRHCLDALDKETLEIASDMIMEAYRNGRKIFIFGNGGSASLSSHLACDLGKGTLRRVYDNSERRLRTISLTDNVAIMTAFANDLSYEHIFIQQLRNLVETGDLIIAISGSGNSKNIIKAVHYAKECGARSIGFLGFKTGGKLKEMVDCAIIVDSNHYGPIEDIHQILGHLFSAWIARAKTEYDGVKNGKLENKAIPFYIE
ncbi:MAG: SIS domain-containing protein [Candidatus Levybacteria bacterium]|nr:SIS domain-containing protein [Candidatus Levybacteria bacterium]